MVDGNWPEVDASTAYAAVVPMGEVASTRRRGSIHRVTAVEMVVARRCLAGDDRCPELLDVATSDSSVAVQRADGQHGDVCEQLRIWRPPQCEGVEGLLQAVDPLGTTPQAPDDTGLLVEGHCIVLAALPHVVQEAYRPLRGAHQEDPRVQQAAHIHIFCYDEISLGSLGHYCMQGL